MIDLPTLPGGTETSARKIDGALVAGWSTMSFPGRRPVAWRTNGQFIDLVDEPIESGGTFVKGDGEATAVRNGLVVGYRRIVPTEESRAFAWREEQGLIDLGVIPGSNESFAFDTDGRSVVGQLSGVGGPTGTTTRAFVWSEARGMRAITPVSITAWATHVRDGRVLGNFRTLDGNAGPFLWIVVVYEDEDPLNARTAVLIPKRLGD